MRFSFIIAAITGLAVHSAAYCQTYGGGNAERDLGTGVGGMIMGFLFIVIIIMVMYSFLKFTATARYDQPCSNLEILKNRYAKGEISKDEFIKIKKELE